MHSSVRLLPDEDRNVDVDAHVQSQGGLCQALDESYQPRLRGWSRDPDGDHRLAEQAAIESREMAGYRPEGYACSEYGDGPILAYLAPASCEPSAPTLSGSTQIASRPEREMQGTATRLPSYRTEQEWERSSRRSPLDEEEGSFELAALPPGCAGPSRDISVQREAPMLEQYPPREQEYVSAACSSPLCVHPWQDRYPSPAGYHHVGEVYPSHREDGGTSTGWGSATTTEAPATRACTRQQEGHSRSYTSLEQKAARKAQRIRLLEKEFGKPQLGRAAQGGEMQGALHGGDEDEDGGTATAHGDAVVPPGGIRSNGALELPHRKTLAVFRWLFLLCTLSAAAFAVLAAVVVRLPAQTVAPAIKGDWTSWAMHAMACASAVFLLWILLVKGWLRNPARRASKEEGQGHADDPSSRYTAMGIGGMGTVVVPLAGPTSMGSAKDARGGLLGKKGVKRHKATLRGGSPMSAPTINFIVDPTFFGRGAVGYTAEHEPSSSSPSSDGEDAGREWKADERAQGQATTHTDDFDSFSDSLRAHHAISAQAKRQRRRQRRRRRRALSHSPGALQRAYLDRLRRRRLHALALSTLRSVLCLSLLVLALHGTALIVFFGFSSAPTTSCTSQGSNWCAVWGGEVASVSLALVCGIVWESLGWVGWRAAQKEGGKGQG